MASHRFGGGGDGAGVFDFDADGFGDYNENSSLVSKDLIIFVVDASEAMHQTQGEDAKSPFAQVLTSILSVYKHKAITASKDEVALCFYGTKMSKSSGGQGNVYVMHDLHVPTVDSVREVDNLINGDFDFDSEIGSIPAAGIKYQSVLWACSDILDASRKKPAMRRITLITADDNPHGGTESSHLRRIMRTKLKDIVTSNQTRLELYGVDTSDHTFDFTLFYKETLEAAEDDSVDNAHSFTSYNAGESQGNLNFKNRFQATRSLAQLTWTLVPEKMAISVKLYSLIQEMKKPRFAYVTGDTFEEVKNETKWVTDAGVAVNVKTAPSKPPMDSREISTADATHEAGKPASPNVHYAFDYGDAKATFTAQEVDEIKSVFSPGLVLLGFKPAAFLRPLHNVTHSYFVYPDDLNIVGSTTVFTSLLETLVTMQQIAICRLQVRRRGAPRVVALVPQLEVLDKNGIPSQPAGFNVITMPFADDIRSVPKTPTPKADENCVELFKTIINGTSLEPYQASVPNPALKRYYEILEAFALEYDAIPDNIADDTIANTGKFATVSSSFDALRAQYPDEQFIVAKSGRSRVAAGSKAATARQKRPAKKSLAVSVVYDDDDETPPTAKGRKGPAVNKKSRTLVYDEADLSDEDSEPPKRGKKAMPDADDVDVEEHYREGKLNKLTVAQLKEYLRFRNITPVGNKANLISQISTNFDRNQH